MIDEILPTKVAGFSVRGADPTAYLLPQEEQEMVKAVQKRREQFTIARTCARRALMALGLPEQPILRGPNREPLWPQGVVGSITHCDSYCAAAVASRQDYQSIGIDAELNEPLPDGVLSFISLAEERAWLADAPDTTEFHWDRLLFSAKESVYKTWFPLAGTWLGFSDAKVSFFPKQQAFQASILVEPPIVDGHPLTELSGRYLVQDGLVLTAIAIPVKP